MKCVLLWLAFVLFAGGCTVAPKNTRSQQGSFDNGRQNSGFYGFGNHEGQRKGLISGQARARFNSLAMLYGQRYAAGLAQDAGISRAYELDGVQLFWISRGSLVKFGQMQQWRRNGD